MSRFGHPELLEESLRQRSIAEIAHHIHDRLAGVEDALELIRLMDESRLSTPLAVAERQINAVRRLVVELGEGA